MSVQTRRTYRNGPYSVTVAGDGAIQVKQGDWLSKYSAAIHNDFFHIHEYARRTPAGQLEPLADPNRIRAGETLYHLPTVYSSFSPTVIVGRRPPPPPALSPAEKKRIIVAALKRDYSIPGENLPLLSKAIDAAGYAENAIALAEIAGLVAEGGLIASVGTGLTIAGVVLFPIGAGISLVDAMESGEKLYAMRGICYATTAWAFGEPVPPGSPRVLRNIRQMYDTARHERAWREASDAAIRKLEADVARAAPGSSTAKGTLQTLLQAIADRDRKKLSLLLMKGMEPELSGVLLEAWKSNYGTTYKD